MNRYTQDATPPASNRLFESRAIPMNARTRICLRNLALLGLMFPFGCGPTSVEHARVNEEPLSSKLAAADSETKTYPESQTQDSHAAFYTVATYDEAFDPAADLAKTVVRADRENKRIILQIGGDWCVWCSRLTNYMSADETVRQQLNKHFLVMKVTHPGEHSGAFLAEYPKCEGYPHLFVLDRNGELLQSQGTGELEKGSSYDQEKFMTFLDKWTPSPE